MKNKEEEQKKKIEEQVSQEIPYSKKKCIDLAYEQGRQDKEQELKKEIIEEIEKWSKGMLLRLETARNLEQIRYKDFDLIEDFINEKTEALKESIIGSKEKNGN